MKLYETEKTKFSSVACQGKEAPYDHPKVYLSLDPATRTVICPYCLKQFIGEKIGPRAPGKKSKTKKDDQF